MRNFNELIERLCPDGVQVRTLGECCRILDKKRRPITKSERKTGKYPYYGANGVQDYVSDYIFDGTFILVGEDGSVQTEQGTPVVNWAEGKIWVNNHAHVVEAINDVNLRYLYYYMQTIKVKDLIHGNIPKLNQSDFRNLKVAVPPRFVQEEIVRILDAFSDDILELKAKLQMELQARKKQYEYYGRMILNFLEEVECVELHEVADIYDALHKTPRYVSEGYSMIRVQDVKSGYIDVKNSLKVEEEIYYEFIKKYCPQMNDIVVSRVGSFGKFGLIPDKKCCLGQNVAIIHPKKNPLFLYYVLSSANMEEWINKNVKGASHKSLSLTDIRRIPIPKCSEEQQKRVIEVMKELQILYEDIYAKLLEEMSVRQKQYEYYRDKLLTFKERTI